jgi:uncharacterized protein
VAVDNRHYDLGFLQKCMKPKLFVSGALDQYGPSAQLEKLVTPLPQPKRLVIIAGGDHFFEGRLQEMREAIEKWVPEALI